MKINKGYYLGQISNDFILWNAKGLKILSAKKLQDAIKESQQLINNKK